MDPPGFCMCRGYCLLSGSGAVAGDLAEGEDISLSVAAQTVAGVRRRR